MRIYPLDAVIRRVKSSREPTDENTCIFILDTRSGELLAHRPLLWSSSSIAYYAVSTKATARSSVRYKIESRETRRSMWLVLSYEFSCPPGNEQRLVRALLNDSVPQEVLDTQMGEWAIEFFSEWQRKGIDVCLELPRLRQELQRHLASRAKEATGGLLRPRILIEVEPDLGPITIESPDFMVRAKDYDSPIPLSFRAALEVDYENMIRACLYVGELSILQDAITNTIRNEFAENGTLHYLHRSLAGEIRDNLISLVNKSLTPFGRRLSALDLEASSQAPALLRSEDRELTIDCNIRDFPEAVMVQCHIGVLLVDTGRFFAAGIDDIGSWIENRIIDITREALSGFTYTDLLLRFDSGLIRDRLQREAEDVGYTIRLVVYPKVEALSLKEGFFIEHVASYSTMDPRIEVQLRLELSGHVFDLGNHKLQRYVKPGTNIYDAIKEQVHAQVQKLLRSVDPQRFYLRFRYSEISGEEPVKDLIESLARSCLEQEFLAENVIVVPTIMESSLTKRAEFLARGPRSIDLYYSPREARQPISMKMVFSIVGVAPEGWHRFTSAKFDSNEEELAGIKAALRVRSEQLLEMLPSEIISHEGVSGLLDLRRMFAKVSREIIEAFGVEVLVLSLYRYQPAPDVLGRDAYHGSQAIDFYSCFLSYSHTDKLFARKLHDRLESRGISCWLDEKDLKVGDPIMDKVSEAIRVRDKVLLCCSAASLQSRWVEDEINAAFECEMKEGRFLLLPLDLDGYLFKEWRGGKSARIRERLAADFTGWEHDNVKFEEQFERVVEALRTTRTLESR